MRILIAAWLSAFAVANVAMGQIRGRMVAGGAIIQPGQGALDDGVAVRMFESPNLDRFLRKAQGFLARDNYDAAIKVLQDVLEGRTLTDPDADPVEDPGKSTPKGKKVGQKSPLDVPFEEDNPAHAVFSSDDRLYRPVRRLCHELLASMADEGRTLYRERFEVPAKRALDEAISRRDVHGLQSLFNRYFLTLSAARAMNASGDLQMHDGRFRAAIQTFRTLLDVYPEEQRQLVAGLSDAYVETKIAVCFLSLGERKKTADYLAELARRYSDDSVRLMGELVQVAKLGDSDLFRDARHDARAPTPTRIKLDLREDGLVPLWEWRFGEKNPYARATSRTNNRVFVQNAANRMRSPRFNIGIPGGSMVVDGTRVLFMDHMRLRAHDLRSGLMISAGHGHTQPSKVQPNKPRARVGVYDFATMRPVRDEQRYYCVMSPTRANSLQNMGPVLKNKLAAYERSTMKLLWEKEHKKGSDYGTFLAAPTVFGGRLFAPMLIKDAYALDCLDSKTGEQVFRVWLHSGGSEFARAPAVPVAVHMGTVYCLTNAGALAAVDAYTGDLLWVRKYERVHPLRPPARLRRGGRAANPFGAQNYFQEAAIRGFLPTDLLAIEGRIVLAPADGKVLLCLDGASGDILWLVSRGLDKERHVIGHNSRYLYLGGANDLMCVDLRSGVRLWKKEIPDQRYLGRGVVTERSVVLPGERQLFVVPADGATDWRTVPLPAFSVGNQPLEGGSNLFVDGPYLMMCYKGGVEVYASVAGMHQLAGEATDPLERASYLVQAGDLIGAIGVWETCASDAKQAEERRGRAARRALAAARDVALAMAAHGSKKEAVALLDRLRWVGSHGLASRRQLILVELLREVGERDAAELELEKLYAMMEGRTREDG